ncbi:hypothetical protein MTsPCn9_34970 [Croceitalea sp. MTPC9]|uniref:conjugative transposon protein TraM n=1 Tax=unclassified Croceitalea TaxID=2632280 RepID=UPI002B3DD2D2|nr:hypothetical protein MTsPCn6_35180 [Croceitalea sp. MTPC6]GMN18557.1 hypothetical protein MTsPCn9_34970 [Croceitalea sp. MTPC9]
MNRSKVIIISIVGLLSIGVIFLFVNAGSGESEYEGFESSPGSQTNSEFTFEDMMESEEGNLFDADNEMIDPHRTKKNSIEKMLDEGDSLYEDENDPKVLELQRQIELLERQRKAEQVVSGNAGTQTTKPLTKAEKEGKYREELLKAREERLARSQDISTPSAQVNTTASVSEPPLYFKASIYQDQFILPGDRVTLILDEPLTYKGNTFKKNTFLFANANIRGSRVLMSLTNIDHVPVILIAKDVRDGNTGMYSKRAGELFREFQAEAESRTLEETAGEVTARANIPLGTSAIRAFSQFFRKKKYKEKDKILLVNNHEVILTTPDR